MPRLTFNELIARSGKVFTSGTQTAMPALRVRSPNPPAPLIAAVIAPKRATPTPGPRQAKAIPFAHLIPSNDPLGLHAAADARRAVAAPTTHATPRSLAADIIAACERLAKRA